MEAERRRWDERRDTIVTLARYLNISTTELAAQMGITRPTMTGRLKGYSRIEPWELPGFALVFGVPVEVLDLEPDEAIRWVLDNPEKVVRSKYRTASVLCVA